MTGWCDTLFISMQALKINNQALTWGKRTYVMGILNATPDSFSGDGLLPPPDFPPIFSENGNIIGMWGGSLDIEYLTGFLDSVKKKNSSKNYYIVFLSPQKEQMNRE